MKDDKPNSCVVIPGDIVTEKITGTGEEGRFKLGPGLRQDKDSIIAYKAGLLSYKPPNVFWVDNHQKRYVPVRGDDVLGVVASTMSESCKVDIGCGDQVLLNMLSFEGASKKLRPNLVNGDVVYGKLISAHKDMEPEISCIDQNSGKANGMGVMSQEGFLFTVSLNLARKLRHPQCLLLSELGQQFKFEIIVGMNGRIYLNSQSTNHIIAIMNMIIASEYMTNDQIKQALNETEENFRMR